METSLPPPVPALDSNDKTLAVLCHLSFFFGAGFVLPLIIYLMKRDESPLLRVHTVEVLNFHISVVVYLICSIALIIVLIGIPLLVLVVLFTVVCAIIGAIKASNNELFHYPLAIPFVK